MRKHSPHYHGKEATPEAALARHLAYLARPRTPQHTWANHHGRGPKHTGDTLRQIEAEHARLIERWVAEHPGHLLPPTKSRSLWANAVNIVTRLRTPERRRQMQKARSHRHLRYHYARKAAQAQIAADGVPLPPPPNKPTRHRIAPTA